MKSFAWLVANTIQALFLVVWSVFWISFALVAMILTLNRNVPLVLARRCWGPGLLWASGARLEIVGGEDLDWSKPLIFAVNHQSMIDIPVCFVALKANLRFVAKRGLAFVPFLGWYMWATKMVFVDRGNPRQAIPSMKRGAARIREGISILAFPEGTRSQDGEVGEFKKGTFMLALEAGVPIVPVAIYGARNVLARDGFRVRPGTIRVAIGAPIPTSGLHPTKRNAIMHQTQAEVVRLHAGLKDVPATAEVAAEIAEGLRS